MSKRPGVIMFVFASMAFAAPLSVAGADLPFKVDSRKLKARMQEQFLVLEAMNKDGKQDFPQYNANRIFKDYQDNEVSADGRYKGKWFMVTGKVSEISKDFRGKPYLVFAMDRYGVASVRADLFEEQVCGVSKENGITSCSALDRAAKLKKGQSIDLDCKGAGMMMKTPMLRECLIND